MKTKLIALLFTLLTFAAFGQQPNQPRSNDESRSPLLVIAFASPETIHLGESTQLTANVTGGTGNYTYQWTPEETISEPTAASTTATPNALGTIVYTVVVNDGVSTASSEATVNVIEQQQVVCPTPENFKGHCYNDDGEFGASLEWDKAEYEYVLDKFEIYRSDNGFDFTLVHRIVNTPSISHYQCYDQVKVPGMYFYRIIAFYKNGCQSDYSEVEVMVTLPTSVDESSNLPVSIYPNPTNGTVTVKASKLQSINVLNSLGQALRVFDIDQDDITIDLSTFGRGLYLLRIQTEDGITTQQVIVE